MDKLIKWGLSIGLGALIGIWFGLNGTLSITSTLLLLAAAAVIGIGASVLHINYVLRYSRNMRAVEKWLTKLIRSTPYYSVASAIIEGDYEAASAKLGTIKNDKLRAVCGANISIANGRWSEAEQHLKRLDASDVQFVGRALVQLYQDDWTRFEETKRLVSNKGFVYALDAEAAFRRGDLAEADKLADLAIAHTAGFQRYSFIRRRERNESDPQRKTYF